MTVKNPPAVPPTEGVYATPGSVKDHHCHYQCLTQDTFGNHFSVTMLIIPCAQASRDYVISLGVSTMYMCTKQQQKWRSNLPVVMHFNTITKSSFNEFFQLGAIYSHLGSSALALVNCSIHIGHSSSYEERVITDLTLLCTYF